MKGRTIKEAIIETLKRANKPLSIKGIYNLIIENDFYRFKAKYPEGIVGIEIRRHCEGINFPTAKPSKHFVKTIDGKYWIKDKPLYDLAGQAILVKEPLSPAIEDLARIKSEITELHSKQTAAFRRELLTQLRQLDPIVFEVFSGKLLEVYGFKDIVITPSTKDMGIDGHGKLKVGIANLNVAFQCKRWKGTVGRPEIDKFRGTSQGRFEQGIFFTTGTFSKDAQNATFQSGAIPVILIDGNTIVDIMVEKRLGVEVENIPVYNNALNKVILDEQ